MKDGQSTAIVGVAVIMLVIGIAIRSIAFPMTKTETTTKLSTTTTVLTQTITSTSSSENVTLGSMCTVISYVVQETGETSALLPTETLGSSTFMSTTYALYPTTCGLTSISTDTSILLSSPWFIANCTFG